MAPDLPELHERMQQAAADRSLAPVSLSMAMLAVFVAVVSLMGGRLHAEAMIDQTKSTDQWAQFQAKVIRERSYEVFLDELTVFALQTPAKAEEIKSKYAKEIDRYQQEMKDIQTQASATDVEVATLERRSDWFDFADVLLEAGLVICSITMLTQKKIFWYVGLLSGVSGILVAVAGLFVR